MIECKHSTFKWFSSGHSWFCPGLAPTLSVCLPLILSACRSAWSASLRMRVRRFWRFLCELGWAPHHYPGKVGGSVAPKAISSAWPSKSRAAISSLLGQCSGITGSGGSDRFRLIRHNRWLWVFHVVTAGFQGNRPLELTHRLHGINIALCQW